MTKLKKMLTWLKNNWYVPIIVVVIVVIAVFALTAGKKDFLMKLVSMLISGHNKYVEEAKKIDEGYIETRREIDERLDEALDKIEKEHAEKDEELTIEEKKEFIKEYDKVKENPDELAKWLSETYNATIVG